MPCGSKPLVGSSRINISGSLSRAEAIAKRCFIPKEKVENKSSDRSAKPTSFNTLGTAELGISLMRPTSSRFSLALMYG